MIFFYFTSSLGPLEPELALFKDLKEIGDTTCNCSRPQNHPFLWLWFWFEKVGKKSQLWPIFFLEAPLSRGWWQTGTAIYNLRSLRGIFLSTYIYGDKEKFHIIWPPVLPIAMLCMILSYQYDHNLLEPLMHETNFTLGPIKKYFYLLLLY